MARTIKACRAKMRMIFPRGYELVYDNYNALAFGYGPSVRASEVPVSFAAYPRWATLFFLQGVSLNDPVGLLEGSGSRVRSVRLESAADLGKAAIKALIAQAVKPRAKQFAAAPRITTVVRAVSAKQRSRRPGAKS